MQIVALQRSNCCMTSAVGLNFAEAVISKWYPVNNLSKFVYPARLLRPSSTMTQEKVSPPPLVLIANDQELSSRSLESILGPAGYAVVRAYPGQQALERARTTQPDLVIL